MPVTSSLEIRRPCGAAWPMAVDGDGWAIALGGQLLLVERRPDATPFVA